jgi:hypothetical protein
MKMIQLWFRKSKRHNWTLYTESDNPKRIDAMIPNAERDINYGDDSWSEAQIGICSREAPDGGELKERDYWSLPKNAHMNRIVYGDK